MLIGTPGSSNALALAQRLGLPEEVLSRAQDNPQDDGSADLLNELQAARVRVLADREEAQADREKTRRLETGTRRKLEDLKAQEAALKVSNGQAAYATLRELKREMQNLRSDEPSKRALLLALGDLIEAIDAELDRAPQIKIKRSLKAGDRVHVRSLGKVGVLNEINDKTNKATVDFGALPMTVALDEIEAA